MKASVKHCNCGAVTLMTDSGNWSMPVELFNEKFSEDKNDIDLEPGQWLGCNYCKNHWGLDLCGCGSGEKVGECSNGFEECKNNIPAQIFPDKLHP